MPHQPYVVGPLARFGVIIPSTNTVVEQDFTWIQPEGVSFHYGRMYIARPGLADNDAFEELLLQIRESITTAVRDIVTCKPNYMLMGMSAETFWGGIAGNAAFEERIREQSGGLGVSTGAASCRAALNAFGAKRIVVFSPYQPVADRQVGDYFREAGFDVRAISGLRCQTATAIAEVGADEIAEMVASLDSPEVDAIVQVGTNLSFVHQAATLEHTLAKPVISINMATLWHALRANGIHQQFSGFGRLLSEF